MLAHRSALSARNCGVQRRPEPVTTTHQLTTLIPRRIVGYHRDELGDWVAELKCGHGQHVRHDPPWQVREWVTTEAGRAAHLGTILNCVRCFEEGDPREAKQ